MDARLARYHALRLLTNKCVSSSLTNNWETIHIYFEHYTHPDFDIICLGPMVRALKLVMLSAWEKMIHVLLKKGTLFYPIIS